VVVEKSIGKKQLDDFLHKISVGKSRFPGKDVIVVVVIIVCWVLGCQIRQIDWYWNCVLELQSLNSGGGGIVSSMTVITEFHEGGKTIATTTAAAAAATTTTTTATTAEEICK